MKAILTCLTMFALVAVQFVGIGELESAHATATDLHAQSATDNHPAPDELDNSAIHSDSHMQHHLGQIESVAELTSSLNSDGKHAFRAQETKSRNSGPPTPPPLA